MILAALLVCMIPLQMAGASSLAGNEGIVISETLTLRESASTSAAELAEIANGEVVGILNEQGNWYRVSYRNALGTAQEGYVLKSFVMQNPEYATTNASTLVYALPSRNAKTVGNVDAGTQLVVIGEWENFWAVNLRTASGFVHKDDVTYSGPTAPPATARPTARPTATPENPVARTNYITVRDTNIYEAPSRSSNVVGVMIAGSLVTIGRIQNGYGQNVDSGYWLSMNDLQYPNTWNPPVIETSTPEFRYFVINDGTNVYAEPSAGAAVVATLAKDTIVVVGNTSNGFGQATFNGMKGWILLDELSLMNR